MIIMRLAIILIGVTSTASVTAIPLAGLGVQYHYIAPEQFASTPNAGYLGCALRNNNLGYYINTCEAGATGVSPYTARLDLPEGALVNGFSTFYYDSNPSQSVSLFIGATTRIYTETTSNYPLLQQLASGFSSGDVNADTSYHVGTVNFSPSLVYQSWIPDGSGGYTFRNYSIYLYLPINTSSTKFGGVLVSFNRQIAPAPASASFTDIPTTHPLFNEIEQLKKSGITLGCGNGNFCPDSPVTRGQMAAFLSRALGLQWDSNT